MIKNIAQVMIEAIKKMSPKEVSTWLTISTVILGVLAFLTYNISDITGTIKSHDKLQIKYEVNQIVTGVVDSVKKDMWGRMRQIRIRHQAELDSLDAKIDSLEDEIIRLNK